MTLWELRQQIEQATPLWALPIFWFILFLIFVMVDGHIRRKK